MNMKGVGEPFAILEKMVVEERKIRSGAVPHSQGKGSRSRHEKPNV